VSKRSINPSHHHQNRLESDDRVRWSKQQRAKSRPKRDLIKIRNTRPWNSILLNDPKWPLMWYLVSFNAIFFFKTFNFLPIKIIKLCENLLSN
jgi:furin